MKKVKVHFIYIQNGYSIRDWYVEYDSKKEAEAWISNVRNDLRNFQPELKFRSIAYICE